MRRDRGKGWERRDEGRGHANRLQAKAGEKVGDGGKRQRAYEIKNKSPRNLAMGDE